MGESSLAEAGDRVNSHALHAQAKTLELFAEIQEELRGVENAIEAALATRDRLAGEVSTYLLRAGGKRIRPALVLLASKFPGGDPAQVVPVAVAVELIHMATLVHDDVVDNAATRRGRPTINARWSNHVSVLTGDYLFARAFSLLAQTGDNRFVRMMADVVFEMSRGELAQAAAYFDVQQTESDYLERIAQKTGYLIAECCRLGAMASGTSESAVQALYNYGMGVGMSFQIADDLLDFTGSSTQVGKPVCGDLKAGILTLPVLHALAHSDRAADLRAIIAARTIGDAEISVVREILQQARSFDYARHRAQGYLENAMAELERATDLASFPTLRLLADFVVNRQF